MRISHKLATLTVCGVSLSISSAGADTSLIYNKACRTEIAEFQQASNDEDAKSTHSTLLLCLAEDTYAADDQNPSPSDLADPLKAEGFNLYFTIDVGGVMAGETEGFNQIHEVIDQMRAQTMAPYAAEQQAKNVIARMADLGVANLGEAFSADSVGHLEILDLYRDGWDAKSYRYINSLDMGQARYPCRQVCTPIIRSGGDGVSPRKREQFYMYFHTDNFNTNAEEPQHDLILHRYTTVPGNQ